MKETVILWLLALVELRAGNWTLAREYAEQTCELAQMLAEDDPETDPEIAIPFALVFTHQSQVVQARRISERGIELAEASAQPFYASWYHGVLGLLQHWAGNQRGRRALRRGMRARESLGFREPADPPYRADYVEALLELGRFEQALAVLRPWEGDAVRLERGWAHAEVTRCRGFVAAARGESGRRSDCLKRPSSGTRQSVTRSRARALLALGVVLRRARKKRAARHAIEQALAGFELLGARMGAEGEGGDREHRRADPRGWTDSCRAARS